MNNIFYFNCINKIGGTEQFLYEIAKKYKDYDITIFYDTCDEWQLKRLKKFVRCIKRRKGDKIVCKKAFFNFNINMIDDVEAEEYYFISHANYQVLGFKPPILHPKLTHFIGVSDFASKQLDEMGKIMGREIKTQTCYNPLTLEPKEKTIIIVSACRLNDNVKGGRRTLRLIEALDKYCEEHNRHYLWLIFSNPVSLDIKSLNVVLMRPRVDVRPYLQIADYVAQLSDDMETFCYTTNEANGYGVPIITTPLSVYNELPITDNERIILDWDCSNVDEVARQIFEKKVKPFKYTPPKDIWGDILAKGNSTYIEDEETEVDNMMYYKVKALPTFQGVYDSTERKYHEVGDEWEVTEERLNILLGNNDKHRVYVENLGIVIPENKEEKDEEKIEEQPKKVTKGSKKVTKKKKA